MMQMMETNDKTRLQITKHATKQKQTLLVFAHNSGRRRRPGLLTKYKGDLSTTEVLIRLLQLGKALVGLSPLESFIDDREQKDVLDLVHPVEIASVVVRPGFQNRKIATFSGELKKQRTRVRLPVRSNDKLAEECETDRAFRVFVPILGRLHKTAFKFVLARIGVVVVAAGLGLGRIVLVVGRLAEMAPAPEEVMRLTRYILVQRKEVSKLCVSMC
jgi:hypothetical protein